MLFGICVAVFVGGAFGWQWLRPVSYETVLALHIARSQEKTVSSGEYRYGDFYRLQADERFADTVVRWLLSPGIVSDVFRAADLEKRVGNPGDLSGAFVPKRLSSQFVEVRFSSPEMTDGEKIANAMRDVLNRETQNLNLGAPGNSDGWFVVLVDRPVTYRYEPNWKWILAVSLSLGVLAGAWAVLVKQYWRDDRSE